MSRVTKRIGKYDETNPTETESYIYEITDEDGIAASLYVEQTVHLIENIEVRKDRQGEGLARALYEYAEADLGDIYHVPSWGRTDDGEGFVTAMGGEVLDDDTAARVLGLDLDAILG